MYQGIRATRKAENNANSEKRLTRMPKGSFTRSEKNFESFQKFEPNISFHRNNFISRHSIGIFRFYHIGEEKSFDHLKKCV